MEVMMNTKINSNFKHLMTRMSAVLLTVLLLPACARQPQPARVEEITFQSGEFICAGDRRTPAGTRPIPVVLFIAVAIWRISREEF
jgi:hypothetical protein